MKPAIICVDDDPIVLASLGEQLSRSLGQDYDIESASSAAEALELLLLLHEEGVEIPVVISDQRMPGISGDELLTQVHLQYPKILNILLTGQSSVEEIAVAVNSANLYRYIAKPWNETDLLLTVTEAVKYHFQEKEITAQREALHQANQRLEKALSLLQATLESTADGILVVDNEGRVTHCNQKLLEIWGLKAEAFLLAQGNQIVESILNQLQDPALLLNHIGQKSQQFIPNQSDILTLKNGKIIECYSQSQRLGEEDAGRVWSFQDITERRAAEEIIYHQAHHDHLTGLLNRKRLNEQLFQLLENASDRQAPFAILFIDIDHFKTINDTLGHALGDSLLQQFVNRLKKCCRPEDLIARWGGDEFTMVLPQISCREDIAAIAQRLLESLHPRFELEEHRLQITCSIGIALYPEDGKDMITLLKNADTALYQVKSQGRNDYQYYKQGLNAYAGEY